MPAFFPRHTIEWQVVEPPVVRRLLLSLVGMAVATGIIIRVYRWAMLSFGVGASSWWFVLASIVGGLVILLGLATAYLGNYPVRHWLWRAPLFGLLVGVTEALVAAAFIALGIERLGTEYAHWHDWPSLAVRAAARSVILVSVFAVILGAVVQTVRYALLKRDRRDSMAVAIHEVHERELEELK
ncbi:MAG: hypothetical protein ACREON_12485 [Gemmatimonadaceae bacterium]